MNNWDPSSIWLPLLLLPFDSLMHMMQVKAIQTPDLSTACRAMRFSHSPTLLDEVFVPYIIQFFFSAGPRHLTVRYFSW